MTFDGDGVVILDRRGCLRLAGTEQLGRLSVTRQALPIIMPVAFGMVDEAPVFRVGPGVIRDAAVHDAVCCFEVDAADPAWAWAWSVMMIGRVTAIVDRPTLRQAVELGLPAWATTAAQEPTFVRIEPEIVSGRWFSNSGAATMPVDSAAGLSGGP